METLISQQSLGGRKVEQFICVFFLSLVIYWSVFASESISSGRCQGLCEFSQSKFGAKLLQFQGSTRSPALSPGKPEIAESVRRC